LAILTTSNRRVSSTFIPGQHPNEQQKFQLRMYPTYWIAAGVMKRLDRIWNQTNLTMPTKIRIYSTCVLTVLLYGSETWTLTQADWKRLDSFHMQCQRWILHTRWYDFVSNNEVLRRTGLLWQPLPSFASEDSDCLVMLPDSQRTSSKPDPSDLLRSPRRCPTISWLETRSWSTSHSGSIRSAGTQEYQWPMLCSWQKNARFGDKSQWRDATAECFASWWWRWNSHEELKSIGDHVSIFSCLEHYVVQMTLPTHAVIVRQDHTRRVVTTR